MPAGRRVMLRMCSRAGGRRVHARDDRGARRGAHRRVGPGVAVDQCRVRPARRGWASPRKRRRSVQLRTDVLAGDPEDVRPGRLRTAREHARRQSAGEAASCEFHIAPIVRPRNYSWRSAAMGSRRAAFTAGHMPKNSPRLVDMAKPATTLHRGTVEGRLGTNVRIARLSSYPMRMPITPARSRQGHRLQQKLPDDIAAPGADGLAYADLARPLGHRDQHDVHYPDAAHQQSDRGDHHHHQRHRGDDCRGTGRSGPPRWRCRSYRGPQAAPCGGGAAVRSPRRCAWSIGRALPAPR